MNTLGKTTSVTDLVQIIKKNKVLNTAYEEFRTVHRSFFVLYLELDALRM